MEGHRHMYIHAQTHTHADTYAYTHAQVHTTILFFGQILPFAQLLEMTDSVSGPVVLIPQCHVKKLYTMTPSEAGFFHLK